MKILVTGGAGYIGSVVVEQLVADGESVVVFDNLSQGHRAAVHPRAEFVEGDLTDRAAVDAALAEHRPEAVMHFASHTLVGESMQRPFLYLGRNIVGGLNLLESMIDHGVRRFILSSTPICSTRPSGFRSPRMSESCPVALTASRSTSWSGCSIGSTVCMGYAYAALRYFNAAGASATNAARITTRSCTSSRSCCKSPSGQRADVTIFGDDYPTPDGTCVRDYIHIVDLAQAHVLALRALDGGSRVYNLGNGQGFSVREVIETARRITGHAIPAKTGPRRPGDPAVLVAGSDKIRRELGWQPRYPKLEQIIETAWAWHRSHPRGYADSGQR